MVDPKCVLVVYPEPASRKEARFGYSVECLTFATQLEKCGFHVGYYDLAIKSIQEEEFLRLFQNMKPERVFIYFDSVPLHRSSNVPNALRMCNAIKMRHPEVRIVALGPWCMINREDVPFADETWMDEPEWCLEQSIHGHYRPSGSMSPRLLESIESLSSPNRSLLSGLYDLEEKFALAPSAVVQTSRGCRMGCRFCPRQSWNNRTIRHRAISECVSELVSLVADGIKNIWIDDDNMGSDPNWSCEFFDAVADRLNRVHSQYGLYFSTDVLASESFFRKARAAGARIVSFGIESGSQKVLDYFQKPSSPKIIFEAVSAASSAGLFTVGNFIVGAPNETDDDYLATEELLSRLPLDEINVKILSIVQGAPLWNEAYSSGRISHDIQCDFARLETGTSSVPFEIAKQRQKSLYELFRALPSRRIRFATKCLKIGSPYFYKTESAVTDGDYA